MPILAILFPRGTVDAHKVKGVGTRNARGRFYDQTGWDHGGDHLGIWSSLGLVLNYVVLLLGNEGGSPHHMQKLVIQRALGIVLRKLVILTLKFHQIFNWRKTKLFDFTPTFSLKALIYIYKFYSLIVNMIGKTYEHLMSTRIFTLIMNKGFTWALKIMRQRTTSTIWIR